jgi:hypothetical protein
MGFVMFLLALFEGVSGLILWLVLSRGGGYRGGRGLATEATSSGHEIHGLPFTTGLVLHLPS